MTGTGSVQTAHLSLEEITDGVVRLAGGQYRAVLEVGSVNFALQADGEQEATVASFAAFLNSLTFPVQILIRVLPIDLDGYLSELERRARALPPALAELARDHVLFLRRLARSRTLLERRFYLVVPAQATASMTRRGWPFGRPSAELGADAARRQLTFRCEEIERQLGRCGLTVRRLGDVELAQLFYACWCPELARLQRLGRELADYTAAVVQAGPAPARRS
ncbi:MAG: hypothetical protein AB7N70_26890 [Dehalococcoidia bacterium]